MLVVHGSVIFIVVFFFNARSRVLGNNSVIHVRMVNGLMLLLNVSYHLHD